MKITLNNLNMLILKVRMLDKTYLKIKDTELRLWYIDLIETTIKILCKKSNLHLKLPTVIFNAKLNKMLGQIKEAIPLD